MDVFARPFLMAPMAGVTDLPFRARLRRNGCEALFTEMVSAAAIARCQPKTTGLFLAPDRDDDLAVQLFGAKPEELATAARMAVEVGWRRLDFNMGCPVKKVVRTGAGAALMREPDRARACLRALREGFDGLLTVKIRSGWDEARINAVEIGCIAQEEGIDGVTLHARTRAQGYAGRADWCLVERLAEALEVPVAGNGDVTDAAVAVGRLRAGGVAAVMIGRAAMAAPWLFTDADALLRGESAAGHPGWRAVADDLARQFEELAAHKSERAAVGEIKKFIGWAVKGVRGAVELRREVMHAPDRTTMDALIGRVAQLEAD